jgi:hypothetical protein
MTDVYISYAREDRERVRPLAETLQFEGWDVWWDPSEPSADGSAALDQKLGSAGAILVVWSAYSRGSEYVRSEAATGLYKNKLIQTRIDSAAPPRPFDQVEVIDLSLWSTERDDPNWRRVVQAVRLFAGAPGHNRPMVARQAPRKKQKQPSANPSPSSSPGYFERGRSIAMAPLIAVGVAAIAGAGIWFVDPFNWRGSNPKETIEAAVATSGTEAVDMAAAETGGAFVDTEESEAAWAGVDRNKPESMRAYIGGYPRTSTADTARSLLRVLDAQAWVDAVTADNEIAYSSYLKDFPEDGIAPGAMAASARERLASLTTERSQAIEEIQRGLTALELYSGKVDGKGGNGTIAAMREFASLKRRPAPMVSSAAPRDLRSFADLIQKAALAAGKTIERPPVALAAATPAPAPAVSAPAPKTPAAVKAPEPVRTASAPPIIAAATVAPSAPSKAPTTVSAPAPSKIVPQPRSAIEAADAADRQRREAAAAAAQLAKQSAVNGGDDQAMAELRRNAELKAWETAAATGTAAAYQTYLASYPAGGRAADARAAVARLIKPSFSLDLVSAEVRLAAEAARKAQTTAGARAAAARSTANAAQTAPGRITSDGKDGTRYETQISRGAPNGLGIRVSGGAQSSGDRYRGEISNGMASGLGVYEFADNSNNAVAGAQRYEGEHSGDQTSGYGVTYWKNGDTFAGLESGGTGAARGVLNFANGQRYEGELRNGVRNGVGVVWSSDGQVLMAGRWENGQLVQPMSP